MALALSIRFHIRGVRRQMVRVLRLTTLFPSSHIASAGLTRTRRHLTLMGLLRRAR